MDFECIKVIADIRGLPSELAGNRTRAIDVKGPDEGVAHGVGGLFIQARMA
jgi:hypothetical protein